MQPYQDRVTRLSTIPGVDQVAAWSLIAELGVDMIVFPDERHCASWAGLCPGSKESAGKQQSTRTRPGNRYLRRVLVQSAWAASRCKKGHLQAVFRRIAGRRGMKKAAVAVAHRILVAAYHILRDNTVYVELGEDYLDMLNPERTERRLTRRLEMIGYQVTLTRGSQAGKAEPATTTQTARKRGRPCKCVERGFDCKHRGL